MSRWINTHFHILCSIQTRICMTWTLLHCCCCCILNVFIECSWISLVCRMRATVCVTGEFQQPLPQCTIKQEIDKEKEKKTKRVRCIFVRVKVFFSGVLRSLVHHSHIPMFIIMRHYVRCAIKHMRLLGRDSFDCCSVFVVVSVSMFHCYQGSDRSIVSNNYACA